MRITAQLILKGFTAKWGHKDEQLLREQLSREPVGYQTRAGRYTASRWHAPAAGALAGLASGLFNNGGPPFNAYMLLLQLPPRTFIATATLFFTLINIIKVPGFLYTGILDVPRLLSLWWVFPFIPLGIMAARFLVVRLSQLWFERVVMAMLLSAAGLLLWQSR